MVNYATIAKMKIEAIKTPKITSKDRDLFKILDSALPEIKENTVVAITSKIISLTQGRVIRKGPEGTDGPKEPEAIKDQLIKREAQWYLPRDKNPYHVSLTITNNMLVPTAGIDESNADGNYVLWPKDPQKAANDIREHIKTSLERRGLSRLKIGVIITDSKTTPLRWGVTGMAIAYSGIVPLKDYVGKEDLFGRKFVFEKQNIVDSLATAAALVMGEGAEQTPIAVISDLLADRHGIPLVEFVDRNPTDEELKSLIINKDEDLYAPLLSGVNWEKGEKA